MKDYYYLKSYNCEQSICIRYEYLTCAKNILRNKQKKYIKYAHTLDVIP